MAVRLRRDFPTILALIEAHALLHQVSRGRNAEGAIIATLEDYSAVCELVDDLVSQGVDATVPKAVKEMVTAVTALINDSGEGVSMTNLAKRLKLDKSSVSRRAQDAIARGFLKNIEEKKGLPARLTTGDPLPEDIEVLPAVEKLRVGCCSVAPLHEGIGPSPSPVADAEENEERAWML